MKTGSFNRPWVVLDEPKPPRVEDHRQYWTSAPPVLSPRCSYWGRQLARGWLPNSRVRTEGYDGSAEWYGIYIWEYLNVISPLVEYRMNEMRRQEIYDQY